jgi:hypothetical protein
MNRQLMTINAILATHRELSVLDIVNYNINGLAAGGVVLIVHYDNKHYLYKILKSGAVTQIKQSDNNISFRELTYFVE